MCIFHNSNKIVNDNTFITPMCCRGAEYPEPLKNLDRLACAKAFPEIPSPVFTAIYPINTTGLFNYHIRKLLVV